jgi:very-short-patch-repair endonuclease
MEHQNKFPLIRKMLGAIGLSPEAIDDIIDRITDFLSDKNEKSQEEPKYPYVLIPNFLSPAEHNFFSVLRTTVGDQAVISLKSGLGDLFEARSKDPSEFRIYRNKIDRKHVDFLLCEPKTVRPLVGIELDDKSHQRSDRQARDEFVEHVFQAAGLPLLRIPVRASYSVTELGKQLQPYLKTIEIPQPIIEETKQETPRCPKCGSEMVLRTAKSGSNQGGQFWGCSRYPQCREIIT